MNKKLTELLPRVFDAGTWTELDIESSLRAFLGFEAGWGGHCSAIAKRTDAGHMLVGRNMDLNISEKPAYVVRTKVPGHCATVGLSYFYAVVPDYADVKEHGLDENTLALLPFLCTDVMNEHGLYMETNMRTGECWPNGESKYACSGTNPGAALHVPAGLLPRLVGECCTDVDEALEYVKTLDVYTASGSAVAWNYCFMMADASGRHGLLEIAANRIFWREGQCAQTNFYVTPELAATEQYKAGLGRYEFLTQNISNVQNSEDMYDLIRKVSYFRIYDPDSCLFDPRSEFVGLKGAFTSDYLTEDANREEVWAYMREIGAGARTLTREQMQKVNKYWESTFTLVADCTEKTLFVRFFEDDSRTLTLSSVNGDGSH